ncbi:olfactory receptor 4P4-like [Tamandua tetradactyla]|uniref:olfactory receptor 4P4-like n=1 Tax=Tamandua tetradactyla TaxID=48850 RepID=UPI004053FCBE
MEMVNNVTEFILLGHSQNKKVKYLCFLLFLFCYIAILMGNLIIVISIILSQLIGQPMYFFLNYLALSDLCYTSVVTPKLVADLSTERNTISHTSCMAQLFTMHFLGANEVFILTVMAYDRCVAICKPQHYTVIMGRWRCDCLVMACCAGAFLHSFVYCLLTIMLPFCGPSEIDHYFRDVYPLLKLARTDTYAVGILVVANSGKMGLVIFVVLMTSYFLVSYTSRAYPAESPSKALPTCSSHITVVVLFFVPVLFIYTGPAKTFPEDKFLALFYTVIAPMFNPLIYTPRNLAMKSASRGVWCPKPILSGKQMI